MEQLLMILMAALFMLFMGKVSIPDDPEKGLKRLIELRGKEELTDEEGDELKALEKRIAGAFKSDEEDAGLTDKQLDRVLEKFTDRAKGGGDDDGHKENRNINANTEIEVGEDRAPDWMRRTVRYFNALVTRKEDSVKADQMLGELRSDVAKMNPKQRLAEHKEAAEAIDESGLSRMKRHALKAALDINTRLHTTSTTDTPKAGYLLPKPFLAGVFVILEQYGVTRRLFRTIPMASNSIDLKNVVSKVVAYWTAEGNNIDFSDLVLGEGQLKVGKLAGITSWTTELEEDMAISLLPLVQQLFAESMGKKEDAAGLLGTSAAAFGGFTGIANLDNAQKQTLAPGGTNPSSMDEAFLRSMKNQLSEARQMNAKWIMHRTVKDAVAQFENSAGYRIFQESITGNSPNQLLGHDIVLSEVMPSYTGAGAGEPFVLFGDYSRTLMGMRRGITADISREGILQNSDDSIAFNAFQADGAILRLTERVGFKTPKAFEDAFAVGMTAAT